MSGVRPTPLLLLSCLLPCVLVSFRAGQAVKAKWWTATTTNSNNDWAATAISKKRQTLLVAPPGCDECAPKKILYEDLVFEDDEDDEDDDDDDDDDDEEEEEEEEGNDGDGKRDPSGLTITFDAERVSPAFLGSMDLVQRFVHGVVDDASDEQDDVFLQRLQCLDHGQNVACSANLSEGHGLHVQTFVDLETLSMTLWFPDTYDMVEFIQDLEERLQDNMRAYPDQPILCRYQHSLRGHRTRLTRWRPLEEDISELYIGVTHHFFYKRQIYGNQSRFQQIDVYDVVDTRVTKLDGYEKSLRPNEDTYESKHPELFRPIRILFLDGVTQSRSREDEAYHEALVHPAMLAHDNPKRVAIIGGGEGATLREVLKHKTVQHCKMIEIDEVMVEAAREHLPLLNDCSPFSTEGSCFDEPRTDLLTEDAFAWFMTRFKLGEPSSEEKFDVVIFDALDPEDPVEFAQSLYQNKVFWGSIFESLTEDGILVMQVGGSPDLDNYAEQYGADKNRAVLFQTVTAIGFQRMHVFEEDHCGFDNSWSFLVACKSEEHCSWLHNEAEVEVKIRKRILPRHDGGATLKHFDGSTMFKYQAPSRAWEEVYCRAVPQPPECLTVRKVRSAVSHVGLEDVQKVGNLFVAKRDMAAGSIIHPEQILLSLELSDPSAHLATSLQNSVSPLNLVGCNVTVANEPHAESRSSLASHGVSPVRDRNRPVLGGRSIVTANPVAEGDVVLAC